MKKQISCLLIFSIMLTTITGCAGSGNSNVYIKEFEGTSYKSREVYNYNKNEVYWATVDALKEKGYQVMLSDSNAGMLTAEYNSANLLPEEMAELSKNQAGATCATILGIVLVVGLIVVIIKALSSNSSSSSSSCDSGYQNSDSYYSESKVISNKYQLTFSFMSMAEEQTEVSLSVIKSVVENGTTVKQNLFENKYLNNGIFKKIDEILHGLYDGPMPPPDSIQTHQSEMN